MKKILIILFLFCVNLYAQPEKETEKEIVKVGITLDLSGKRLEGIKSILNGIKLVFDKVNYSGEFKDKKFTYKAMDDRFDPKKAKENIDNFLEQGIDIILSPFGSVPLKGYIEDAKKGKILLFLPESTSPDFRKSEYKNTVFFLASSDREGIALADYAIKNVELKKYTLIYHSDDNASVGALNGFIKVLSKNNIEEFKDWIKVDLDLYKDTSILVKKIKEFDAQNLVFLIFPQDLKIILKKLDENYWIGKNLYMISTFLDTQIKTEILSKTKKVISSQLVPDIDSDDNVLINEYKKDLKNSSLMHEQYLLEGYIHASIFINLCKNISGKINKESLLEQAEKLKGYNFKSFTLNFNPSTRELSSNIWLKINGDKAKVYNLDEYN